MAFIIIHDMHENREQEIINFLDNSGLEGFIREKIPGDASFRKYERIKTNKKHYILMDAPPEKEDIKPFVKVDEILLSLGLKAPKIYNASEEKGFLLLEDFGNSKYTSILETNPEFEESFYKNAVDVLVKIFNKSKEFKNSLPEYSKDKLLKEAELIFWYIEYYKNYNENELQKIKEKFSELIKKSLAKIEYPNNVITLRDFHADNLMFLNTKSFNGVGLLDFQDALIGNPAYDVVSLLEDARRDVTKTTQIKMIDYFVKNCNLDTEKFFNDYNILGAQRNLKILGIFTRLKQRDGKDNYLKFIPRVNDYLKQDLQHDNLKNLREFLEEVL